MNIPNRIELTIEEKELIKNTENTVQRINKVFEILMNKSNSAVVTLQENIEEVLGSVLSSSDITTLIEDYLNGHSGDVALSQSEVCDAVGVNCDITYSTGSRLHVHIDSGVSLTTFESINYVDKNGNDITLYIPDNVNPGDDFVWTLVDLPLEATTLRYDPGEGNTYIDINAGQESIATIRDVYDIDLVARDVDSLDLYITMYNY